MPLLQGVKAIYEIIFETFFIFKSDKSNILKKLR